MFGLRRVNLQRSSQHSAEIARERLLHDRQMRRNQNSHPGGSPSALFDFPSAFLDADSSFALAQNLLTSSEQRRQAIQIAQTFRQHYLAAIAYREDRQVAVALVRPIQSRKNRRDVPHEICVDAAGNVMVAQYPPEHPPQAWLALGRLLMFASVLTAILGAFSLVW